MRPVKRIIIHCAATPNGRPTTAVDIDRWHRERGFRRRDEAAQAFNPHLPSIGYHFVVLLDGSVETGRHESEIGAHAAGYNTSSIGICLVGTDKFTPAQWSALAELVKDIRSRYDIRQILGHGQLDGVHKACPCFDARAWAERYEVPSANVL